MLEKAILESTLFYNLSRIYQQFKSVNTLDINNKNNSNTITNNQTNQVSQLNNLEKNIMAASIKFKTILFSIFQTPSPMLLQKSMRHVDAFEDSDNYRIKREKNNESVRKSRAKNRVKLQECSNSVKALQIENIQLNQNLEHLQSELQTLKGLFQHCFSFNLNNLAIKPSDIPTSTLYKIIMQNKTSTNVTQEVPKTAEISSKSLSLNEVDNYYVNQIKNALSNIVKTDLNSPKN